MSSIVFDDVIYWLQRAGGITTYWNEITRRIGARVGAQVGAQFVDVHRIGFAQPPKSKFYAAPPDTQHRWQQRLTPSLARYGTAPMPAPERDAIFHTSYYRQPSRSAGLSVVTVYDFTYELYRSGLPRAVHSWQKFAAIRNADLVICISHNTLRDVLHFMPDVDAGKCVAIPLGVSDDFHRIKGTEAAPTHQVVFVGDRSGYKRFDLAVDAVALCPELELVIVGAAPTEAEQHLLDSRLPRRWRYAGRISILELNQLYNSAFALIYPSAYEGFGLPLLEAMRAGCPVVCSNLSSLPEVGASAARYAAAQDACAYAVELQQLSADSIRASVVGRGLERARQFTWDACAERTLQAYDDAARRR
jgi:mannosyltransferase